MILKWNIGTLDQDRRYYGAQDAWNWDTSFVFVGDKILKLEDEALSVPSLTDEEAC